MGRRLRLIRPIDSAALEGMASFQRLTIVEAHLAAELAGIGTLSPETPFGRVPHFSEITSSRVLTRAFVSVDNERRYWHEEAPQPEATWQPREAPPV